MFSHRLRAVALMQNTMYIKTLDDPNIFAIPSKSDRGLPSSLLQVIGVTPGQILTEKRIIHAKLDREYAVADPRRDLSQDNSN